MIKINNNSISLVKGDSTSLKVNIVNGYNFYKIKSGDSLVFYLNKNINDQECLLQKNANINQMFYFTPEDTSDLKTGTYFYNIKLFMSSGEIYTIVPISKFILIPSIGERG